MEKKKSNNTFLYGGIAILGIVGIATFATSKKPTEMIGGENLVPDQATGIKPTTTTSINKALVLKNGSKGIEVAELQKLLGVTTDGVFGTGTETALYNRKGVKEISLNGFASMPDRNLNPYNAGDKIMAYNPKGTVIYKGLKKADNTFYTNWDKEDVIDFGQEIGTIRSWNEAKTVYSVNYSSWLGTKIIFVKAQDVKKY